MERNDSTQKKLKTRHIANESRPYYVKSLEIPNKEFSKEFESFLSNKFYKINEIQDEEKQNKSIKQMKELLSNITYKLHLNEEKLTIELFLKLKIPLKIVNIEVDFLGNKYICRDKNVKREFFKCLTRKQRLFLNFDIRYSFKTKHYIYNLLEKWEG